MHGAGICTWRCKMDRRQIFHQVLQGGDILVCITKFNRRAWFSHTYILLAKLSQLFRCKHDTLARWNTRFRFMNGQPLFICLFSFVICFLFVCYFYYFLFFCPFVCFMLGDNLLSVLEKTLDSSRHLAFLFCFLQW